MSDSQSFSLPALSREAVAVAAAIPRTADRLAVASVGELAASGILKAVYFLPSSRFSTRLYLSWQRARRILVVFRRKDPEQVVFDLQLSFSVLSVEEPEESVAALSPAALHFRTETPGFLVMDPTPDEVRRYTTTSDSMATETSSVILVRQGVEGKDVLAVVIASKLRKFEFYHSPDGARFATRLGKPWEVSPFLDLVDALGNWMAGKSGAKIVRSIRTPGFGEESPLRQILYHFANTCCLARSGTGYTEASAKAGSAGSQPLNVPGGVEIAIALDVPGSARVVRVSADLKGTPARGFQVSLRNPVGTSVVLGRGSDFLNDLRDGLSTEIDTRLHSFLHQAAGGDWCLVIRGDDGAGIKGTLEFWTLEVTGSQPRPKVGGILGPLRSHYAAREFGTEVRLLLNEDGQLATQGDSRDELFQFAMGAAVDGADVTISVGVPDFLVSGQLHEAFQEALREKKAVRSLDGELGRDSPGIDALDQFLSKYGPAGRIFRVGRKGSKDVDMIVLQGRVFELEVTLVFVAEFRVEATSETASVEFAGSLEVRFARLGNSVSNRFTESDVRYFARLFTALVKWKEAMP